MCNAWNHSFDCVCGFGGDASYLQDHSALNLRKNAEFNIRIDGNVEYWVNHGSYLGKSSLCPYCLTTVFFVRYNGGCVWLNALAWPWPRHPCFYSFDEKLDNSHRYLFDFDQNRFGEDFHLCCVIKKFHNLRRLPNGRLVRTAQLVDLITFEKHYTGFISNDSMPIELGQLYMIKSDECYAYSIEKGQLLDVICRKN